MQELYRQKWFTWAWQICRAILAYFLGVIAAAIFYISWFYVSMAAENGSDQLSWQFKLGFAATFCIIDGFLGSVLLMALPWMVFAYVKRHFKLPSSVYFPALGAILTVGMASMASSLSPKPLFIEDQTFLEGALIALQRQGICYTLAGLLLGFVYWLVTKPSSKSIA